MIKYNLFDILITFTDLAKEPTDLKCKVRGFNLEEYESQDVYRTVEIVCEQSDETSKKLYDFLSTVYNLKEENTKDYAIDGTLIIKKNESYNIPEWHLKPLRIVSVDFEDIDHSGFDEISISMIFEYLSAKKC